MKVNRLGKIICDQGYKNLKDFVKTNDLKVNLRTLYGWCTKYSDTPKLKSYVFIDSIADALNTSRIDVLNMIATKAVYDVEFGFDEDNFLKAKRKELGFKQYELAELIGCDNVQVLCDMENGKRMSFPNSDILKNYLEALDISFSQFQSALKEIHETKKPKVEETVDSYGLFGLNRFGIKTGEEVCEIQPVTLVEDKEKAVEYETVKSPITATDKEKIMSLIYGQVDYETFKAVEIVLRGAV